MEYHLSTPLSDADIKKLNIGDVVYLSNKVVTARDGAHLRLQNYYNKGIKFEENLEGCALFHAGPIIKIQDNQYSICAIGPTTSSRMEPYTELIGKLGVKAIIGKGGMGNYTKEMMQKYNMVYLAAAHGCAAIHTQKVKKVSKQYWMESLGMPEAVWVLEVEEFGPLVVGIDAKGNNQFEKVRKRAFEKVEEFFAFDK